MRLQLLTLWPLFVSYTSLATNSLLIESNHYGFGRCSIRPTDCLAHWYFVDPCKWGPKSPSRGQLGRNTLYIPRIIYMVPAVFCLVLFGTSQINPYPSVLLQKHNVFLTMAHLPSMAQLSSWYIFGFSEAMGKGIWMPDLNLKKQVLPMRLLILVLSAPKSQNINDSFCVVMYIYDQIPRKQFWISLKLAALRCKRWSYKRPRYTVSLMLRQNCLHRVWRRPVKNFKKSNWLTMAGDVSQRKYTKCNDPWNKNLVVLFQFW